MVVSCVLLSSVDAYIAVLLISVQIFISNYSNTMKVISIGNLLFHICISFSQISLLFIPPILVVY